MSPPESKSSPKRDKEASLNAGQQICLNKALTLRVVRSNQATSASKTRIEGWLSWDRLTSRCWNAQWLNALKTAPRDPLTRITRPFLVTFKTTRQLARNASNTNKFPSLWPRMESLPKTWLPWSKYFFVYISFGASFIWIYSHYFWRF